ncbi:hypothetical protein [Chitinophaga sp. HK235]|uniref:hypothetical protein n=1 Tax=Chitinophaga sp. HK235 TaxID=2952571 RepID=UPI001BA450C4|nr:hypothetical protein [Chitinophaga sp. HK235]
MLFTVCTLFGITFGCQKQTYSSAENLNGEDIPYVDLINGHGWRRFSGATIKPEGILIQGLDRGTVPKPAVPGETIPDGVDNNTTPNPPYNLQLPYLKVKGDFILSATITIQSRKSAMIYFCGQLPDSYDEWKQEGKSIAIGVKDEMMHLIIRDGKSVIEQHTVDIGDPKTIQFMVKRSGNKIEYYVNNILAGSFEDVYHIFEQGKVYFGAEAEAGSTFLLNKLQAKPANEMARIEVLDNKVPPIIKK